MSDPTVFGARYSVYTRIVRLALEEKGVPYTLEDVDIFAPDGPPLAYLERHPFARIPAFEHDGFHLYESAAIARYVEEAFQGPALLPAPPQPRARVAQLVGLLDSYGYRTLVWDVFVERVRLPQQGRTPDEGRIAGALIRAETCLQAMEDLRGEASWLVGDTVTLADLHAAPMFALFRLAPEGADLLERHPRLLAWWQAMDVRPSMVATRSPIESGA